MDTEKKPNHLNIVAQCHEYGVPLIQCPQFVFLLMGIATIITIIISYQIGARYIDAPELVALVVLGITVFMFVISFSLTRSFERLAEASRMKSEFINIVSHQLRSPLSNLRWAIDFLMSGKLGRVEESQTEYYKILRENSTRMAELVGDLLTASRIEQGTLPTRVISVSLKELAEETIKNSKPFADAYNTKIIFNAPDNLPNVLVDPSQIKLVLENLLDNAIRYIVEKGEINIKIEQLKDKICYEIKDSGVGIPEADQKFIFQKFFRSGNVMRHQTKGTGLGLFIAKSIIEKSDGEIGFRSREGKGTTFWFTLPMAK